MKNKIIVTLLFSVFFAHPKGWLSPTVYRAYYHKQIQNPAKRVSGYPFITGDTFRLMADHICDETDLPFDPTQVKYGDIIFVGADVNVIPYFFKEYHDKIANPYIVISHNDDTAIPGHLAPYLDDPKLLIWFAQNIDRKHPKLVGLPIGFSNPVWGQIGSTSDYLESMKNIPPLEGRSDFAYMNFNMTTSPKNRTPVVNYFQDKYFIDKVGRKSHREYLEDMKKYKFVISPPGNGVDCHRHWEALLMGAIPVMLHSSIDCLFDDLPAIFVNDWREVTPEFLNSEYQRLKNKSFKKEKLLIDYWISLIKSTQQRFINMER